MSFFKDAFQRDDLIGRALGKYKKPGETYGDLDSRNPNYANNALAYFTRDQYSDWLKRFQGIAAGQIKYATDDTQPGKAADEAGKYVQNSFARIPGQLERLNAREGLTLTPDEQASQQRSIATAGGLADVTARNRAAQQTYDRQNSILTGVQSPATASIRGLQGGQP